MNVFKKYKAFRFDQQWQPDNILNKRSLIFTKSWCNVQTLRQIQLTITENRKIPGSLNSILNFNKRMNFNTQSSASGHCLFKTSLLHVTYEWKYHVTFR